MYALRLRCGADRGPEPSMIVEPKAVSAASPRAMPSIRATVTVAEAIPWTAPEGLDGRRRARGDGQPEPQSEQGQPRRDLADPGQWRPRRHRRERRDGGGRTREGGHAQPQRAQRFSPETSAPPAVAAASDSEGDAWRSGPPILGPGPRRRRRR